MVNRSLFSPRGFILRALVITAGYALAHFAGLREYTTFLSGTVSPGADPHTTAVLGVVYLALYFAWTLGVPILLLAAGIFWAADTWLSPPSAASGPVQKEPGTTH